MCAWNLKDLESTLLIGSTLVEGSTLSENEAKDVLAGRTVQGHPILEIRELLNYRAAVACLMTQFTTSPFLSVNLVQEFHLQLFHGFPGTHGTWKSHQNFTYLTTGTRHNYLTPAKVGSAIQDWVNNFNRPPTESPSDTLANLYYEFEQIHPFEDGNGRIGRILITYWLHWKFNSSWEFYLADRIPHLKALEAANRGDFKKLALFFKSRIKHTRHPKRKGKKTQ